MSRTSSTGRSVNQRVGNAAREHKRVDIGFGDAVEPAVERIGSRRSCLRIRQRGCEPARRGR